MKFSDVYKLAYQNNKAGKKFATKIIIGTSVIYIFLVCIISILFYYKDYISQYEENYADSCYIFSDLENEKNYERAIEKQKIVDFFFDSIGEKIRLGKVEVEIDGRIYVPHNVYVPDSSRYYDLYGDFAEVVIRENTENVDDIYLIEGKKLSDLGTLMVDDYLLTILGIYDYNSIINKKISIRYDEKNIISDYLLTGVFDVTMYDELECDGYHDFHYEHIYVNAKADECFSRYGNNRYYFSSYKSLMKAYEHTEDYILLNKRINDDELDSFIPAAAYEVCISIWFMKSLGKGIMLLLIVISCAIVYSIYYYLKSYYARNERFIDMLHNIGMTYRDIKKLHNFEMLIMICISILVTIYVSILMLSGLAYITNKYLTIGYSIKFISVILSILLGIGIMFILKMLSQISKKKD